MRGRKPIYESRAAEFRQKLVAWKQSPESSRPSLRALARELGTSHQMLSYHLAGLEEWRQREDLERFRANCKVKGVTVTPALEKRYLAWLKKIEEQQERSRVKADKVMARTMPRFCKAAGVPYTGNFAVDKAACEEAMRRKYKEILRRLPKTWESFTRE